MGRPNVNWSVGNAVEKQHVYGNKILKAGVPFTQQVTEPDMKYIIKCNFNLDDESVVIPENCIFEFQGGSLSDGTLVGDGTQVYAEKVAIFSEITIEGEWNVPEITTAWFEGAEEKDDTIKQAFNLCSDNVYNTITVETGDYWVTVPGNEMSAISLRSHLTLNLIGNIRTRGHGFYHNACTMVIGSKTDITIIGNGYLYGDKELHDFTNTSSSHESDHVLRIGNATDIVIDGLNIRDATGDGIDLLHQENDCRNIVIKNFTIENCRRQGITAGACNLIIENGKIKNVLGTLPAAGIDIEITTSSININYRIHVKNLKIEDCYMGFQVTNNATNKYNQKIISFDNIEVINCGRGFSFNNRSVNMSVRNCFFSLNPTERRRPGIWPNPSTKDIYTLCAASGSTTVIEGCTFRMEGDIPEWATQRFTMLNLRFYSLDGQITVKDSFFNCPLINAATLAYKCKFLDNKIIADRFVITKNSLHAIVHNNNIQANKFTISGGTVIGNRFVEVGEFIWLLNSIFTDNTISFKNVDNYDFGELESHLFHSAGGNYVVNNVIVTDHSSTDCVLFENTSSSSSDRTVFKDNWFRNGLDAEKLVSGPGINRVIAEGNISGSKEIIPRKNYHPLSCLLSSNRTLNTGALLFSSRTEQSMAPISNTGGNNTTKSASAQPYTLNNFIYVYLGSSTVTSGSVSASDVWTSDAVVDLRYSVTPKNINSTPTMDFTIGKYVYMKAMLGSDGLIRFINIEGASDSTTDRLCTQDLPVSDAEILYIRLGLAMSENEIILDEEHPSYIHREGKLVLWEPADTGGGDEEPDVDPEPDDDND